LLLGDDGYNGGEPEISKLGIAHRGRCGEASFLEHALDNNQPGLGRLHATRPKTTEQRISMQISSNHRAR